MKKTKVIIPALGLLLLSTAASVSGTVAWFAMNTTVSATGMLVQAKAEEGIVISSTANGTYAASVDLQETNAHELYPTSTWNCSDWYHSVSTNPGAANDGQAYSAVASADASQYYVSYSFFIRSSAASAITVASLNVQSVTVTGATQELSKALRVGVVFESDATNPKTAYIYGPVTGATASYSVHKSDDGNNAHTKAVSALAGNTVSNCTGVTSIPANTAAGTQANVYVWFEGEDAACKSDNIVANLENLTVGVSFTFTRASN